jgi:hypothetical protein
MDEHETTARLAVSAIIISSICANALSKQGLLPSIEAKACADEMMSAAAMQEAFRQSLQGDGLPADFAIQLQSLARLIQSRIVD